jgi:ubiquinone biosynthesis protein UbiJ
MFGEEICRAAIELYGSDAQERQCIEECAELIQAINKKHRGKEHNIAEEIADVENMLFQVKEINDCFEEVKRIKREKLERLAAKMSSGRI